jgi:hypothetical protein
MKNSIKKFLEFNGKAILFLDINGQYWVALRPICDALGINYSRQWQNIKSHKILSQLYAIQHMVGADLRLRKMVALPEKYIYGWLFSIKSESQPLQEYQMKCYELLYEYFHGTIGRRHAILSQKAQNEAEMHELENVLRDDKRYVRVQELKGAIARSGIELKELDKLLVDSQLSLFN